jgi:HD-GYP domain-containing protein (c-di-GMP phosphodiesterase class II)
MEVDLKRVRIVDFSYLSPGSSFYFDILDKNGSILYPKNKILTKNDLEELKKFDKLHFIPPKLELKQNVVNEMQGYLETVIEDASNLSVKSLKNLENLGNDLLVDVQKALTRGGCLPILKKVEKFNENLYNHAINMGLLSLAISISLPRDMGLTFNTSDDEQQQVIEFFLGAVLHDIGMVLLPKNIWQKNYNQLSNKERHILSSHPYEGYKLIKKIEEVSKQKFSEITKQCILFHHERLDNKGYPTGVPFSNIPKTPRLVAIIEMYESLVNNPNLEPHELKTSSDALKGLVNTGGIFFEFGLIERFVNKIGIHLTNGIPFYKKGDCVLLSTGEFAYIEEPKTGYLMKPIVRIAYSSRGDLVDRLSIVDLKKDERKIKRFVTPEQMRIYLKKIKGKEYQKVKNSKKII